MLKTYPIAAFCTYNNFSYAKLIKVNNRNRVTYTQDITNATIWESVKEYEKACKKSKVLKKYTRLIFLTPDEFPELYK